MYWERVLFVYWLGYWDDLLDLELVGERGCDWESGCVIIKWGVWEWVYFVICGLVWRVWNIFYGVGSVIMF